MESGTRNGSVTGNAPAPLNPIARVALGWAKCVDMGPRDTTAVDLEYSLTSPRVYRWRNSSGDDFYAENRRFDRAMSVGGLDVPDYNSVAFFPPAWPHGTIKQGILVWRHNSRGDARDPGYSQEGLLYASGRYGQTYPEGISSETDDGIPFPGVAGVTSLSPWSDPRNPYTREPYESDPSRSHYTLYVPNTKGGTTGGFEIISEDSERGTFRVVFRLASPANMAAHNQSTISTATAHGSQRKLFRQPGGRLHLAFESGGEIFYRRSHDDGRTWADLRQASNGNGGNAAPSIAGFGRTILIVWQVQASGQLAYAIHSTRSTDDGLSWSPVASLGLLTNCTAPGPLPTAAGSGDDHAIVLFRSGVGVSGRVSSDGGVTWMAVPPFPGSTASWGAPACGLTGSAGGPFLAHVAAADEVPAGGSRLHYGTYDLTAGSWSYDTALSDVLPAQFRDSRNPCVAATSGDAVGSATIHVVWDVQDAANGSNRVVAHRVARHGSFALSYNLIANGSLTEPSIACTTGDSAILLCQRDPERELWRLHFDGNAWRGEALAASAGVRNPQVSAGSDTTVSLWTGGDTPPYRLITCAETSPAPPASVYWGYARSLTLLDPGRSAALEVCLGACKAIRRTGITADLPLCDIVTGDTACSAASLMSLLQTRAFSLDERTDSIQVEFRLTGSAAGDLFSSRDGSVALQVVRRRTGEVLGTFARHHGPDIAGETDGLTRMSVSLERLQDLADEGPCVIRVSVGGFSEGETRAILGQVYSRGCQYPVSTCCGWFEEFPTLVSEENRPEARPILHQNYPNPFNASTTIRYGLSGPSEVRLEIYNSLGQRVKTLVDGALSAGEHASVFDGSDLASGQYFCRLSSAPLSRQGDVWQSTAQGTVQVTRMLLLR